jgi:hypothetical protein
MIDELKEILLNSDNEVDALNKLQEVAAKDNILEALEDEDLGISIESLGLTIEDLDNEKYMYNISEDEIDNRDLQFAKADLQNLYRYVAHTSSGYGSDNIGTNSRSFCKKISKRTNVSLMRYVDILKLNGSNKGFGAGGSNIYSVFKFRGGVNCKHIWVKYVFNKKTKSLVEAPRVEQPRNMDAGDVGNA